MNQAPLPVVGKISKLIDKQGEGKLRSNP